MPSAVIRSDLWQHPEICGAMTVSNPDRFSPLVDGFDQLNLIVTTLEQPVNETKHFLSDEGQSIQERWIDRKSLGKWILVGQDRRIIQWLLNGEIVMERFDYLSQVRKELLSFSNHFKAKKLFIEFNLFLSKFLHSKEYLHDGHFMDAYSNTLVALHHWARLVIIEEGYLPELTVWNQVKTIHPAVYKLYDELVQGNEELSQRIELVLLASEFSVMTKMPQSCAFLIDIIRSRPEGWTIQDLMNHPDIVELKLDISLVLNKLVNRSLIKEAAVSSADWEGIPLFERRYLV